MQALVLIDKASKKIREGLAYPFIIIVVVVSLLAHLLWGEGYTNHIQRVIKWLRQNQNQQSQ